MKPVLRLLKGSVVILGIFFSATLVNASSAGKAGSVGWFSAPKEVPNGWYWMYDDASEAPFEEPILPPMPEEPYSEYSIRDDDFAEKLAPYNNQPFAYTLPDSFWFYGYWIETGDKLYISPDGWVSFDFIPQQGFPDPPTSQPVFPNPAPPNNLMAPLWANYDPTRTTGDISNNRVYYRRDRNFNSLIVEWYRVQGAVSGEEYSFLLMLQLGGQNLLESYQECGVVSSYHLIEFLYNTTTSDWDGEGAATGIENPDGLKGITYAGTINTSADSFHAVRAGYKRIFAHDVVAWDVLSPGYMVLRYTPVEPEVVVANQGNETEHFTARLEIFNQENLEKVYEHTLGSFNLLPGAKDTIVAPCWTPEDLDKSYLLNLSVDLDRDQCEGNNIYGLTAYVGCEDTLRYYPGHGNRALPYTNHTHIAAFYESDGGLLVTGAEVSTPRLEGGPWIGAVWKAQEGCGLPQDPPLATAVPVVDTPVSVFKFPGGGSFIPSAVPGNVWVGITPTSSNDPALIPMSWSVMAPQNPCFMGTGNNRSAFRTYGLWEWPESPYSLCLAAFAHLGFGDPPLPPRPSPPCWEGGLHDLACYGVVEPIIDYVEAGQPVDLKVAVSNLGYQAEPDSGFIPVELFVVDRFDTTDTVFSEVTEISQIGWLGDQSDDPDTVTVAATSWTPEGECSILSPIAYYQIIGVVKLGKIGPDSTDHCPYNDTVRREVECLWPHDVGLAGIYIKPPPHREPNWYEPGTELIIDATVENFGYHAETDIPVRCEIRDLDENDELVWHSISEVEFLDWRGNQLGRPNVAAVFFPGFVTPNDHHMTITCRTELPGDQCPKDDHRVVHINGAVEEESEPASFALKTPGLSPCSKQSVLTYTLPSSRQVNLKVYDVSGKLISVLVDESKPSGEFRVVWDHTDDSGRKVTPGIYLIRLKAGEFSATGKIVVY